MQTKALLFSLVVSFSVISGFVSAVEENGDSKIMEQRNEAIEGIFGNFSDSPEFMANYVQQMSVVTAATAVGGKWANIGPTTSGTTIESGRPTKIFQDPSNKNTVYVVESGGGLWKTPNFFDTYPTWIPLTDFLVGISGGSGALGSDPSIVYFGVGDPVGGSPGAKGGFIYVSKDGGNTWGAPITLGSSTSIPDIQVDTSASPDSVIVSTNSGIFRSTDDGASFAKVYSNSFIQTITRTSLGWVGYDQNNKKFLASTDRGATWATPAGSNWATVTGGLAQLTTIAVGVPGDSIVYALCGQGSSQLDIFRSTDGGLTWVALGVNSGSKPVNGGTLVPDLNLMSDQAWYNDMLIVDGADPDRNTVYFGGSLASAKTIDGGKTWNVVGWWYDTEGEFPYVHADYHCGTMLSSQDGSKRYVVFGNDGGLYTSPDGGKSFTNLLNTNLTTLLANFISGNPHLPDQPVIGIQDNGTRMKDKGTKSWNMLVGGDGEACGFSQAVEGYLVTSYVANDFTCFNVATGNTLDCNDGIDRDEDSPFFSNLATPLGNEDPTGTVFFTLTSQSIYKSSLSGSDLVWSKIATVPTSGTSNGISSANGDFCISFQTVGVGSLKQIAGFRDGLNGYCGVISFTTDGGTNWKEVDLRTQFTTFSSGTSPIWVSGVLYVASTNSGINAQRLLKSTDSGTTWTLAQTGLPDLPIMRLAADPNDDNTIYAALWGSVYVTSDAGASWNKFGSGLPSVTVTDIYINSGLVYVSTYGRSVWKIPSLAVDKKSNGISRKTGLIVGLFLGGVAFILIVAFLVYYLRKRTDKPLSARENEKEQSLFDI